MNTIDPSATAQLTKSDLIRFFRAISSHMDREAPAVANAMSMCANALDYFPDEPSLHLRMLSLIQQARRYGHHIPIAQAGQQAMHHAEQLLRLHGQPALLPLSVEKDTRRMNGVYSFACDHQLTGLKGKAIELAFIYFPDVASFRDRKARRDAFLARVADETAVPVRQDPPSKPPLRHSHG